MVKSENVILQPQFRTSTGRLTAYSFHCGYIEEKAQVVGEAIIRTQMWHEGACYHVRCCVGRDSPNYFWDCFDTLAEARNRFGRVKGKLTTKRMSNNQAHGKK